MAHAPPKSPKLYLTPQIEKRRDGLVPSLMTDTEDKNSSKRETAGSQTSKRYRTNSKLLLQIKELEGQSRETVELGTLIGAVQTSLYDAVEEEEDFQNVDFSPKGCIWRLEFAPTTEAEESYRIEVICLANEVAGVVNYTIDTILTPKDGTDPNPLSPPKGAKEAKQSFENLALRIRKSVVALEFPEFPEGCKGRAFREVYQLNARLKSGSFATVCRGTHRATGRKVAIKCVLRKDLPPADDAAIYDEVAILSSLNHPYIVPIIDFFDEKDCYFIVMELMSGGDLFDRIGKKKAYSEADARDLVIKMLKAVSYCHNRRIAHCDMKPKNLLLMSEDNDSFIKLADFGFAARVHEPKSLTKQCGTPFFVSPEILTRKPYDQQSDMWSVGCIIFLLLSGNLPFMGRSQKELFRKIVAGKFEFKEEDWASVSEDGKDLVRKCLVSNPDARITAAEALRHQWLKASKDRLNSINLQGTSQRLKNFNARMKLRTAMIAVDWVSSLKRMSVMSTRNITGSGGAVSARDSNRNLMAAAKQKLKSSGASSSDRRAVMANAKKN